MLEIAEKFDQLQFRQSALAEQFQRFCQFFDGRTEALASQQVPTDAALQTTALAEHVVRLREEIVQVGQIISQRQPELADTAVRDFQFLLAAWADEAMIKMLGQDRLPMAQHGSIERGMFGTVHAGDEFFNKIAHMLERRNMDDICLAGAYWLALMQGFEGRYIGGVGANELRRYANGLQAIALQKIALQTTPKPQAVEFIQRPMSLFNRIGLWIRPSTLLALSIVLLLTCLIGLEMQWRKSTVQLTQTLKASSDLRQTSADRNEMK
jgi:type VI protein secretion system component VasF